jgi:D-serine deaminase-like pyridoxal phosphate-dependent protein
MPPETEPDRTSTPTALGDLTTPCALVDLERVEHNTAAAAHRARALGVRLRPHVKTHKCLEAARLQVRGHFGGITVSTLAEARAFAAAGFDDITYAVPIAPQRVPEALLLARELRRLTLLVDHRATVDAVEQEAAACGRQASIMLKVDCGLHRAGVDPADSRSLDLAARLAASPAIDFRGLLTHAGQAYACRHRGGALEVARHERDVLLHLARRLRARGVAVEELSVGATPTFTAVDHLDGITEARPGNSVFFDAFQAAIGSCTLDDVAFTVLTTVIGVYPARGELLTDAGALALSADRGPVHVDPDCGFGVVLAADGRSRLADLRITRLSQEHGVVRLAAGSDRSLPAIGDRLRIVPNHSCLAAALHGRYHVLRGDGVVACWRPVRGW